MSNELTDNSAVAGPALDTPDTEDANIERLNRFREIQENWDSYGGKPIDHRAIDIALRLAPVLADWQVVPRSDGNIQFERNDDEICIDVSPVNANPAPSSLREAARVAACDVVTKITQVEFGNASLAATIDPGWAVGERALDNIAAIISKHVVVPREDVETVYADGFCARCSELAYPLTRALEATGVPTGEDGWQQSYGPNKVRALADHESCLRRLLRALAEGKPETIAARVERANFSLEFHATVRRRLNALAQQRDSDQPRSNLEPHVYQEHPHYPNYCAFAGEGEDYCKKDLDNAVHVKSSRQRVGERCVKCGHEGQIENGACRALVLAPDVRGSGLAYCNHRCIFPSAESAQSAGERIEALIQQWRETLQDGSHITDEDAEDLMFRLLAKRGTPICQGSEP